MRTMTVKEQRKVLEQVARARFGAGIMLADVVCYGGQVAEYRDAEEYVTRVIEAFPKDIRQAYDAEVRKAEADKLRAEADRIERGEK